MTDFNDIITDTTEPREIVGDGTERIANRIIDIGEKTMEKMRG